MKKIQFLAFAAAVAAMSVFSSCDDDMAPSNLTEDAVAVRSTVCGYVQYSYTDYDETTKKSEKVDAVAKKGTTVVVEYSFESGVDKEGKPVVINQYKEVKTNKDGFFTADVVVPVGKTANVTISTNFLADNFATNKSDTDVKGNMQSNFYGTSKTTVNFGQLVVLNINAAASGVTEDAWYGDSLGK